MRCGGARRGWLSNIAVVTLVQTGPINSALWALAHVAVNPQGVGLRPALVCEAMSEVGFVAPRVQEMIGELTKVIVATKPH